VNRIFDWFPDYYMISLDDLPSTINWPILTTHSEVGLYEANKIRKRPLEQIHLWLKGLIEKSDKEKIIFCKRGELFSYYEFERILFKLEKDFPSKTLISFFNDYRELDTKFLCIPWLGFWVDVWAHNSGHHESFRSISNSHQRKKLFINKNNKHKDHRLRWVEFLEKHNLKSKGYVSEVWNGVYIENDNELPDNILYSNNEINYDWSYSDDWKLINYYNNVFCEIALESEYNAPVFGCWHSPKSWPQFMMCLIPMIIGFKNWDDYLRDAGFDMFDDVIDTSFYKTDDLNRKFSIIKSNLKIIENDLTVDGKFRDDIWDRLKRNQSHFLDLENYKKYLYKKLGLRQ